MAEKKAAKGGKQSKSKASPMMDRLYEKSGSGLKAKNPSCPKCGSGTFLAMHKDRKLCGKCGYMEKR